MVFPEIATLVPHAKPMLLLDRVLAADEESLCAEVIIREDSLFFSHEAGGVGAWVGVEYMAQAVAAYAGYKALQEKGQVKIGFLLGTRRYECHGSVFTAGSVLRVYVRCLLQADNGLGSFECTIEEGAQTRLASATINAFQPDDLTTFLGSNSHE